MLPAWLRAKLLDTSPPSGTSRITTAPMRTSAPVADAHHVRDRGRCADPRARADPARPATTTLLKSWRPRRLRHRGRCCTARRRARRARCGWLSPRIAERTTTAPAWMNASSPTSTPPKCGMCRRPPATTFAYRPSQPRIAPASMRTPAPIDTGPSTTTRGPMLLPAPTRTSPRRHRRRVHRRGRIDLGRRPGSREIVARRAGGGGRARRGVRPRSWRGRARSAPASAAGTTTAATDGCRAPWRGSAGRAARQTTPSRRVQAKLVCCARAKGLPHPRSPASRMPNASFAAASSLRQAAIPRRHGVSRIAVFVFCVAQAATG